MTATRAACQRTALLHSEREEREAAGMPHWLKLRSRGRGRRFSPLRGLLESALAVCYAGEWPARFWGLLPGASHVREIRRTIAVPGAEGGRCRIAFLSDLHVGPTT